MPVVDDASSTLPLAPAAMEDNATSETRRGHEFRRSTLQLAEPFLTGSAQRFPLHIIEEVVAPFLALQS